KMFTHRICCCSATVASQVMAIIAIVMGALLALSNWLDGTNIYLDITQTVIVVIELIACILVFVAVCTIRPVFMIPIIVIMSGGSCKLLFQLHSNGSHIWGY
ncbi:hypothetical protein PENTCL1PPCAC_15561, partial [Pristionchus entomophagus]